jgi:hypothetical protein
MRQLSKRVLRAMLRISSLMFLLFLALPGTSTATPAAVVCHYTYGGEERTLSVLPTRNPYLVEPVAVGSYFQFKVVVQDAPADVAGVKIYTYADQEPILVLIHQASYPFAPHMNAPRELASTKLPAQSLPYGFTGRQWVYEPVRDGELQYWCEWKTTP